MLGRDITTSNFISSVSVLTGTGRGE